METSASKSSLKQNPKYSIAKTQRPIKILWMMSTGDYSKLREIEGCAGLEDVPSTKDLAEIEKMKDFIGYDHVFVQRDPSLKEMSKTWMEIYKLCKKYTAEKKPHMLSFYGGGHGVTFEE